MKSWTNGLGSTVFVVLLMTSMLAFSIPSVTSSPGYGVEVLIDSLYNTSSWNENVPYFYREGMPGGELHCRVFVKNIGTDPDNYTLSITDPKGWGSTITPPSFTNVPAGKYVEASLTIPIPGGTALGTEDNVKVTATGPISGATDDNFVTACAANRLKPTNHDTFIDNYTPNENKDKTKAETMYIGYYSVTQEWQEAYLKFDLRGIKPGNPLENVRLWIYCYSGYPYGGEQGVYGVYHVDNDNWVEENTSWNRTPSPKYNELVDQKYLSGIQYTADNWLWWDVTSIVRSEYWTGDNILSLFIRCENFNENGASISTRTKQYKDASKWPYLDVGGRAVSVSIDPPHRRAFAGGTFYYTVTVKNLNVLENDNYNLTPSDNCTWGPVLENTRFENVRPGEERTTKLRVTAPKTALVRENDLITVTAKSDDNVASASDSCKASIVDNELRPSDDDVWAGENEPNTNNAVDRWVRVESWSGTSLNARAFYKFDLRGLPPDNVEKHITSAKLILYCWVAEYDNVDVQCLIVDNDNWTEETLTWGNQPAYGDVLDTVPMGSWPENLENQHYSWDITPYVAAQRLTDNIVSFCLKAEVENTSGRYQFDGKEWKFFDNEDPCLAITLGPENNREVSVSISPVHRVGDNGENRTYTVKVMNMGNVTDSYTLENTDSAVWSKTLTPSSFTGVKPGESKTATLTVTLSSTPGAEDNIWVAAISQTDPLVKDNKKCTASVRRLNGWEVAGYAPRVDNYGVAVVGAGGYTYVANSNTLASRVNFMRCDNTGEWKYLSTPAISTPFKNGTCLAWDGGNYIYALLGGAYGDNAENRSARHYFYRYKISTNTWERLRPTGITENENENSNLGAQGAGDALAVAYSGTPYGSVYAIVGNRNIGSTFWKYRIADNSWTQLTMPTGWTSTDDGCSLVWTGGEYLYALRGEYIADGICKSFSRYSIWWDVWTSRADILEGVGDGGSLVWTGGNNIYALAGGNPTGVPENIRENIFFAYSISGNNWTKLENLPKGIGEQNGMRLGSGSDIYCWRGCKNDSVLWVYPVPKLWEVTANITLENAIAVTINVNGDFFAGENLVARFYLYKGTTYQDNTIVCDENIPGHVTLLKKVSRPGKEFIARVELVVVDSVGTQLGTLKFYEASKTKLFGRLATIDLGWQFASPETKSQWMGELGDIDLYWPTAPLKYEDL